MVLKNIFKKYGGRRIALIAAAGLLTLWIVLSILWFAVVHSTYSRFKGSDDSLDSRGRLTDMLSPNYVYEDDGYMIQVFYPKYPSLTSNLVVSTKDDRNSLFIWPALAGKARYGVMLYDDRSEADYGFKIDVTGKELKAEDPLDQERLDSRADIVRKLLDEAHKEWGDI